MFDQALREAMRTEMHLFLREVLFGDRSALELLQANYTFAQPAPGRTLRPARCPQPGHRVQAGDLTVERRGGLLTQAGLVDR